MSVVWRIARTEVLEHWRQPWMLGVLVLGYVLWVVPFGVGAVMLDEASRQPEALAQLQQQLRAAGMAFDAALWMATSSFLAVAFTNLPLYVAIMSGYSILHDRDHATLPFLMLAPLSRRQLVLGKLLGALAIPLLLHVVFTGGGVLLLGQIKVLHRYSHAFGGSAAWWVAFAVGAPASALAVGALGTVVSALSSDVRTSMQYTSFFIGLLSLGIGFALVDGLSRGLGLQLAFAGGCLVAAALILLLGARLISRDITPS